MRKLLTQIIRLIDEVDEAYTMWRQIKANRDTLISLAHKNFVEYLISLIDWDRLLNGLDDVIDRIKASGVLLYTGSEHEWASIRSEIKNYCKDIFTRVKEKGRIRILRLISDLLNIFDELKGHISIQSRGIVDTISLLLRLISFKSREGL